MATRGVPAQIRVDINACSPMHVLSQNNVAGRSLQPSQASIQIPRRTSSVLAAFACSRSNDKLCRCLACSRAPSGGQLSKHSNKPKSFNKSGSSSRQVGADRSVADAVHHPMLTRQTVKGEPKHLYTGATINVIAIIPRFKLLVDEITWVEVCIIIVPLELQHGVQTHIRPYTYKF
jgi:hypothetical protein